MLTNWPQADIRITAVVHSEMRDTIHKGQHLQSWVTRRDEPWVTLQARAPVLVASGLGPGDTFPTDGAGYHMYVPLRSVTLAWTSHTMVGLL